MKLRLTARLWTPTIVLLVMMVLMLTVATLRTRSLIDAAGQAQREQQSRLTLSYEWQGLLQAQAMRLGSADAGQQADLKQTAERAASVASRLDKLTTDPTQRQLLQQAARPMDAASAKDNLTAMSALITAEEAAAEALHQRIGADRMRTVWLVGLVMGVVAIVLAVAATVLVRTICRPLAELAAAARRIGEGDLDVQLDDRRHDEIGDVMRAVLAMRDGLRGIVGQVQESAESIHVASQEVSVGNLDLSQRTERAAVNLQRTASGMTTLAETMQHSTGSAGEAERLAAEAAQVAQKGGDAMTQVVSTMAQINQASRQIADIIGVIDGIAFQTNILALNAAVEAARAGEQGRGFAVVASEVRNLAGRSATAAREIKTLITASVEAVDAGGQQVRDAGQRMTEIVQAVQNVSIRVGEITADAANQSQGMGMLHESVNELDQMTQQNAALVEESAAAAESLKEQAGRLSGVVARFRLGAGNRAQALASPRADLPAAAASASPFPAAAPAAARTPAAPRAATPSRAPTAPAVRAKPIEPVAARPVAAPSTQDVSSDDWATF